MRTALARTTDDCVFSPSEIAQAARVPVERVREAARSRGAASTDGYLHRREAIHLVRTLRRHAHAERVAFGAIDDALLKVSQSEFAHDAEIAPLWRCGESRMVKPCPAPAPACASGRLWLWHVPTAATISPMTIS